MQLVGVGTKQHLEQLVFVSATLQTRGFAAHFDRLLDLEQYVKCRQDAEKALSNARERASTLQEALASLQLIELLCDRIGVGLPLLTFADKREFLQALDLRVIILKDSLEITGVLNESSFAATTGGTRDEVVYFPQRLPQNAP